MTSAIDNVTPVNIVHIASGDLWAGAEVQLYTLVRALHYSPGISVRVILLNHGTLEEKLYNEGIEVLVIDEARLSSFQILRRILQSVREQRPDVIHTHRLKENILGSIAGYLAGRIPSLRTIHGAPEHQVSWWQFPKRIKYSLDRLTAKLIQRRIIAVSEELAVLLRQTFPADKIRIIENGIDIKSLSSLPNKSFPELDGEPKQFRIGLAGRLVPIKRADLFILAARHFQDNYPDIKAAFYIFGDGPLRSELKKLSRQLGVEHIVHFEGHCDDMIEQLRNLDMLVMTSDHEGLPMILLEAMALSVPVITHATGGIPALLDNGSCGALVTDHCPEGYAYEMYRLTQSPTARSKLTENALERVRFRYSAEENARSYLAQYNEIRRTK